MKNNTVFILLAGGKSERMGVDKGLLKYKHTFWILEQLRRISASTIQEVYIGLGYNYENYFYAIPWFEKALVNAVDFQGLTVKVIVNEMPEFGSFSTLQTVLKKLNLSSDILLNPVDVPLLNSEELNKIILEKNNIVIPNFEGKNGHPIKMNSNFWHKLVSLQVLEGNSRLDFQIKKVNSRDISVIKVKDATILKNLNTKPAWISYFNEEKK